ENAAALERATAAEAKAVEASALAQSKGALAAELVEARSGLEAELAEARAQAERLQEEGARSAEALAKLEESNRAVDDERRRLNEAKENLATQLADLAGRDEGLARDVREKDAELQRTLDTLRLLEANQERERSEWQSRIAAAEALHAQLESAEGQRVELTQQ